MFQRRTIISEIMFTQTLSLCILLASQVFKCNFKAFCYALSKALCSEISSLCKITSRKMAIAVQMNFFFLFILYHPLYFREAREIFLKRAHAYTARPENVLFVAKHGESFLGAAFFRITTCRHVKLLTNPLFAARQRVDKLEVKWISLYHGRREARSSPRDGLSTHCKGLAHCPIQFGNRTDRVSHFLGIKQRV